MSEYGVIPTGFSRKPLPVILAELEAAAVQVFGPGVIQTSQSPLGQLHGLMADYASQLWEFGEDVYASYDPDQAEGVRLDALARIRVLERVAGETDASLRQAITNTGRARIDLQDVIRAISKVQGVTYAQLWVNDTPRTDEHGLDPHSVSLSVLGGDDTEIATVLRDYIVPGIGTSGTVRVNTMNDGFCRPIWLSRPAIVPVALSVSVQRKSDRMGCPPASLTAVKEGLVADLQGARRTINGETITLHLVRSIIEARYPNVEVMSATGFRLDDEVEGLPIRIDFHEIAEVTMERVSVVNA